MIFAGWAIYLIEYEYRLDGQTCRVRNRVKKNSFARTLEDGQCVTLLANEKHPNIAFIRDIYTESI